MLYFDMEKEGDQNQPVIKGVYRDGRDSGILVRGLIGGWSRDGAWFAFLTEDGQLRLRDLQGAERTVFTADEQEHIFLSAWQSIWSPDSRRIALLLLEGSSAAAPGRRYSLVIIDVPTASVVARRPLPSEMYERANWAPYKFRWSPDGRKILLAWQTTAVVDVDSGSVMVVAPSPVFAEWAPDSSAVYYFDRSSRGLGDFFVKKRGSGAPVKLIDKSILKALGWEPVLLHGPLLSLSPSGSRLAVAVGALIQLYELKADEAPALDNPSGRFPAEGVIAALEWSPDERSLAVLATGAALGQPGAVAVQGLEVRLLDLTAGQWRTLATLSFVPGGVEIDIVGLINTLSWTP